MPDGLASTATDEHRVTALNVLRPQNAGLSCVPGRTASSRWRLPARAFTLTGRRTSATRCSAAACHGRLPHCAGASPCTSSAGFATKTTLSVSAFPVHSSAVRFAGRCSPTSEAGRPPYQVS